MAERKPVIIDGTAIAAKHLKRLAEASDRPLGLGIIVATDNPATETYVGYKQVAAKDLGWRCDTKDLGPTATQTDLIAAAEAFNANKEIDGYIVQLPLPDGVNEREVFATVDAAKDADGLTPENLRRLEAGEPGVIPATPRGILTLLEEYNISIEDRNVTVVGQGKLTGGPLSILLEQRGAKVTRVDRSTADLAAATKSADVLIVATGNVDLITADMVKEGVAIIDVGINKLEDGVTGDVDFEGVKAKASAITPVPGGVGPMTVASLLENVYDLSR
ncbi:bifunctional 5,10-methylenetetrahydrofolate dehydrogenase/5,10-methenyltetrahydrofolate cyclohydrolase [Patescibacteria group bacterium]|nr:bifunctional 5,10-methylenetetrahydrofolate dehydrogenase/5,10-methenyltetrahydrofolate cyclohydrolase [Patescibacteria group bacterium]